MTVEVTAEPVSLESTQNSWTLSYYQWDLPASGTPILRLVKMVMEGWEPPQETRRLLNYDGTMMTNYYLMEKNYKDRTADYVNFRVIHV